MTHWVKIFSSNGDFEGIFIPTYSDEHQITIYADFCIITMPWQNISRAVFIPKTEVDRPYNYDTCFTQLSLFPVSQ